MAFANVSELADVLAANTRVHMQFIHKTTHADGASGNVIDLSMAAGNPKYNAYVGDQTTFTPMQGDGNFGIYTGEAEPGRTKYLTHWWLQTMSANNVGTFFLLDYVGFYPLIDFDSTDQQDLDNTATPTRNQDGAGLRMMLVTTTPSAQNADFTVSYTNQAGVAGRTITCSAGVAAFTGNIITGVTGTYVAGACGPFLPLAEGDTGVRSVQSITFAASAGGFGALVLVRPIEQLTLLENATVTELDLLLNRGRVAPIADDAYLNMIAHINGSVTPAVLRGGITIARN